MDQKDSIEIINLIKIGYNFIPDYFNIDNKTQVLLMNLSTLDYKIFNIGNNFDMFFLKKYSIFKKDINYKNDINHLSFNKHSLGKATKLILPSFYYLTNNVKYEFEIHENNLSKINSSFSFYKQNLSLKELSETSYFIKNYLKFLILDLFTDDSEQNSDYINFKKLTLFLLNIYENLEVFITLFYFCNNNLKLKELINYHNEIQNILDNIKPNNISKYTERINLVCSNITNSNTISAFINKTIFKKSLINSCLVSKDDAFYSSASGSNLRSSGVDIDFNRIKNTVIGEKGSTWERFYTRKIDINRTSNEIISICKNIKNFEFKKITKQISKNLSEFNYFENANGLVFSYLNFDNLENKLFIKLHFSSINNINLLNKALGANTPYFDYFLISLNISTPELALNRPFIIKNPLEDLSFIYS